MFGCIHVIIHRHACKLNTRSQRETYITDGKHASLGICVRGNTHPWETHITVTPEIYENPLLERTITGLMGHIEKRT